MQSDLVETVRDARVEMDYEVWLEAGVAEIPLRGIQFRPTTIAGVRASLGRPGAEDPVSRDDELTVVMDPDAGLVATGRVLLDPPPAEDGPFHFWLSYEVRNAAESAPRGGLRYRLPVLVAGWTPDEAARHTFVARTRLSSDLTVTEAFPTVLRDITVNPNVQRVGMDLQVVPALLSFRTERGRGAVSGLMTSVDMAVLILLSVMLVLGAWHLERVSAGRGR